MDNNQMNMEWLNEDNTMMSTLLDLNTIPQTFTSKEEPENKLIFKEPIFMKEMAQPSQKKKKAEVSSDSEDDLPSAEQLKTMTSKERRQFRNRISARNFRVRRKEYIVQLEQRLDEKENTITELKRENEKLRKANKALVDQMISQPPLVPSPPQIHPSEEFVSSSSSEGQSSPEPFSFPLDNLYSFGLFDHPDQPTFNPDTFNTDSFNSLFLNHAALPDLDFHRVLSEKMGAETTEEGQEILANHPLLGAALMSIILRHTMSLEYVVSVTKQFTKEKKQEVEDRQEVEENQTDKTKNQKKIETETGRLPVTKDEIYEYIFNHCFGWYAFARAKGKSHSAIMAQIQKILGEDSSCSKHFYKKIRPGQEMPEIRERNSCKALTTYCKVAATLLKNPKRMMNISRVLKDKIEFPQIHKSTKPEGDLRIST
ncbi:unnamed protein product [Rhizopus stolonifer]